MGEIVEEVDTRASQERGAPKRHFVQHEINQPLAAGEHLIGLPVVYSSTHGQKPRGIRNNVIIILCA